MTEIQRIVPDSENIFIDIVFCAEFWDKAPTVDIYVDDKFISTHAVDRDDYHVKFRHRCGFGPHTLKLHRRNKTDDQNRQLPDGTYLGQMLIIKQVKLDNIDLRNLVWHSCKFRPEYPEPWATQQRDAGVELESELRGEMNLGHNGTWSFEFTSPVYKFLVNWVKGSRA
jgi:hypothetical protein